MHLDATDIRPPVQVLASHALEGNRIEPIEADRVVARLVFRPPNRDFIGNRSRRLSKLFAARMQSEFGNRRAHGQHAQRRSGSAELRILPQAPRHGRYRQCRAKRMADNDDFIDIGFADFLKDLPREIVDPFFNLRSLTMEKLPGKDRVIQHVIYSAPRSKPAHQRHENDDGDEGGADRRPYPRETGQPGRGIGYCNAAEPEQDDRQVRKNEESRILPVCADVTKQRAVQDKLEQGEPGLIEARPHAPFSVALDEIIPAEQLKGNPSPPVRAPGLRFPAGAHFRGIAKRRGLRRDVPGAFEPRKRSAEPLELLFRNNRIISADMKDMPSPDHLFQAPINYCTETAPQTGAGSTGPPTTGRLH